MSQKVLFISPFSPFPANEGNKIRILHLMNTFKKNHFSIDFLLINHLEVGLQELRNDLGDNHVFFYKNKKKYHYRRLLPLFFRISKLNIFNPAFLFNYRLDYYLENDLIPFFKTIIETTDYTCIMCEYLMHSKLLTFAPKSIFKIIDTHDKFTNRWKIFLDINRMPFWYSLSKKAEKRGLQRADLILAIQENEQKYFEEISKNKIITIPCYLEKKYLLEKKIQEKILFIGSGNPFNIASLEYFLDNIFDLLLKNKPNIKLLIAGGICKYASIYKNHPNIELLGFFDHPESVYKKADIVINPMTTGTGLKIKSIEALSFSKYLVASKSATSGLDRWANKAYLLANSPKDYVDAIINLLDDENFRTKIQDGIQLFLSEWNDIYIKNINEMIRLISTK